MRYRNDDPMAILAMERERTGNYGEDGYFYGTEYADECPVCGAYEPDYFYLDDDECCVGCSKCIYKTDFLY